MSVLQGHRVLKYSLGTHQLNEVCSDTFRYVVGAIIANVIFLHGRKVVILFVILLKI